MKLDALHIDEVLLRGTKQNADCVIMTCYTDFDTAMFNIEHLSECFDVYLHIDKKATIPQSFLDKCAQYSNVTVASCYPVNWGSILHLAAVLRLLNDALSQGEYRSYSIWSENESSIYSVQALSRFFANNKNSLIEMSADDNQPSRINEYHFMEHYNVRSTTKRWKVVFWKGIEFVLRSLGIRPHLKYQYPNKGYLYCSLTGEYVRELKKNWDIASGMLNELQHSYVGEEYFFQNFLLNCPNTALQSSIVDNCEVYSDWKHPQLGSPARLTSADIDTVKRSGKLFMRKVSVSKDAALCSALYADSDLSAVTKFLEAK